MTVLIIIDRKVKSGQVPDFLTGKVPAGPAS